MKKLVLIAALGICATGSAFAQNIDKNSACWQGLTKEYNALIADRTKDTKNIDKSEAAAFDAKLNKLKADWGKAQQGGVTQKECEDQRTGIKALNVDLNKMQAAANSSPSACIAEFKKVAAESDKIYADGIAKKTISGNEAVAYKRRDVALQKQFNDAVADKKLSLAECNGLLKSANDEKMAVTKMAAAAPAGATPASAAAVDPKMTACRADLDKEYKAVQADYAKGVADKKIDAKEAGDFKAKMDSLRGKWTAAQQGGVSLQECTDQVDAMKKLHADLGAMLK
ncbi:MAG: hypothetical protein RLY82_710 [Pseudomonadota bacterium]|jgi:hypothetical protein